jgi:uncharacterized membrane protein (DUF2068 family)
MPGDPPTSSLSQGHASPQMRGKNLLRVIGVFKLCKSALLIAAAISVFHLLHKNLADVILEWSRRLHIEPGNYFVEKLLDRVLTVTRGQLIVVGIVALAYAAMFAVEGIGLLMLLTWAEWMTVITTCGLIPFEIFEIARKPGAMKVLALIINIAVAVYLFFHVRGERSQQSQGD